MKVVKQSKISDFIKSTCYCYMLYIYCNCVVFLQLTTWQHIIIKHVIPLGHIILIPSHPLFCLPYWLMMRANRRSNIYLLCSHLVWHDRGWNPQTTAPDTSTLTITPPMCLESVSSLWKVIMFLQYTFVYLISQRQCIHINHLQTT